MFGAQLSHTVVFNPHNVTCHLNVKVNIVIIETEIPIESN